LTVLVLFVMHDVCASDVYCMPACKPKGRGDGVEIARFGLSCVVETAIL